MANNFPVEREHRDILREEEQSHHRGTYGPSSHDDHCKFRFSPETCYSGKTRFLGRFSLRRLPLGAASASKIHGTQLAFKRLKSNYSRAGNRPSVSQPFIVTDVYYHELRASRWKRISRNREETDLSSALGARQHAKLVTCHHLATWSSDLATRHWRWVGAIVRKMCRKRVTKRQYAVLRTHHAQLLLSVTRFPSWDQTDGNFIKKKYWTSSQCPGGALGGPYVLFGVFCYCLCSGA